MQCRGAGKLRVHEVPLTFIGLAFASSLVLSACGGGGDADLADSYAASTDEPAATEPDSATADERDAALAAAPTITATCGLTNFQTDALQRINTYRQRGATCGSRSFAPAGSLVWRSEVIAAATRHSNDMVSRNFFSHTGSDGSSAGTRLTQAGYRWAAWDENIAAGQRSVPSVVDGWMANPGHCANIMNPTYRAVGLACVKGTSPNPIRPTGRWCSGVRGSRAR